MTESDGKPYHRDLIITKKGERLAWKLFAYLNEVMPKVEQAGKVNYFDVLASDQVFRHLCASEGIEDGPSRLEVLRFFANTDLYDQGITSVKKLADHLSVTYKEVKDAIDYLIEHGLVGADDA